MGRSDELPDQAVRHIQFWKLQAQRQQFLHRPCTLFGRQDLGQLIADLRREQTEPDFVDFRARRPKFQKLANVAGFLHHLPGDRAVNGDPLSDNVLEDPVIGRWRAANIVIRLQSVNGNRDGQMIQIPPLIGDLAERAGHHLHVYTARQQDRNESFHFAVANQRIPTHQREV